MKKLLFMMNSLYGGGAEKVLQTILNNLDYSKYDVTLYSMHREEIDPEIYKGDFTYRVVFDSYQGSSKIATKIHGFFSKIKGWIFNNCSSKLFYKLFIKGKYDVEIAFIEGESTKIIAGSDNKKSKKLAWVHIDMIENPWTSFLFKGDNDEAEHYKRFDKILCVSDSTKNAFIKKYSIDSNKVQTQYNPIDRQEILQKSMLGCNLPPKQRIRMISVGRLVAQKGFDRLLRIVSRLKNDGFDFELYILGEGEDRKALEEFIDKNDLYNTVILQGFESNPYSFMRASDLMVCSSRAEGFSTVVSEGVVIGMPVVSTDCAGVRELFGEYPCGIITENDEDSLYEALRKVLSNPSLLEEYRAASEKRGEYFSLEKTMAQLEELFDE